MSEQLFKITNDTIVNIDQMCDCRYTLIFFFSLIRYIPINVCIFYSTYRKMYLIMVKGTQQIYKYEL